MNRIGQICRVVLSRTEPVRSVGNGVGTRGYMITSPITDRVKPPIRAASYILSRIVQPEFTIPTPNTLRRSASTSSKDGGVDRKTSEHGQGENSPSGVKSGGVLYEMPLTERGLSALLKMAAVSGASFSWLTAAVSYATAPHIIECAPTLAVAAYTSYLLRQVLLWSRDKPIRIEYDEPNSKPYTLTYRGLLWQKSVTFTAGEVIGPPDPVGQLKSDLEKRDTMEKRRPGILQRVRSLYRESSDPQAMVVRPRTPERMTFRINRNLVDLDNAASRLLYRKQIEYAPASPRLKDTTASARHSTNYRP